VARSLRQEVCGKKFAARSLSQKFVAQSLTKTKIIGN
jgi:hypothetical protein